MNVNLMTGEQNIHDSHPENHEIPLNEGVSGVEQKPESIVSQAVNSAGVKIIDRTTPVVPAQPVIPQTVVNPENSPRDPASGGVVETVVTFETFIKSSPLKAKQAEFWRTTLQSFLN